MDFETFWHSGPWLRLGKRAAARHFHASVKTPEDWARIQQARDRYAKHLAANQWQHPLHGSTWFNNWADYAALEEEAPRQKLTPYDRGYYDGFIAD